MYSTCLSSGAIMSRLPALGLNKALLLSFSGWRQLNAGRGEDEHGSLDAPAMDDSNPTFKVAQCTSAEEHLIQRSVMV